MKYCCSFNKVIGSLGNTESGKQNNLRFAKEVNEITQSCGGLICEIINQHIENGIEPLPRALFQVYINSLNDCNKTKTMLTEIFFELENIIDSEDDNDDCDFYISLKPVRCSIGKTANIIL